MERARQCAYAWKWKSSSAGLSVDTRGNMRIPRLRLYVLSWNCLEIEKERKSEREKCVKRVKPPTITSVFHFGRKIHLNLWFQCQKSILSPKYIECVQVKTLLLTKFICSPSLIFFSQFFFSALFHGAQLIASTKMENKKRLLNYEILT